MSLSKRNLGWGHSPERITEKSKFLEKYKMKYLVENEYGRPIAKTSSDYYHQHASNNIQVCERFIVGCLTPPLGVQQITHFYFRAYFVVPNDISDSEIERLVSCGASYIKEQILNQIEFY